MIADWSYWRPDAAALAGIHGALRYVSHDPGKAISAGEMADLHGLGVATALVFEDGARRAEGGTSAGKADAEFAAGYADRLGVPSLRPVYVAVDWDIADYAPHDSSARAKLGPIGDYLQAWRDTMHPRPIGVYGGYWAVSRAVDAGLAWWLWQTAAWSGGAINPRVMLYQPGAGILGGHADLDLAGAADWGQFRRGSGWLSGAAA